MPWTLLPNDYVSWQARDENSAWLALKDEQLAGRYLVTFEADGRISKMESDRLLLEGNDTYQREVGLKQDYAVVNGFNVPTRLDYTWTLEDGTVSSHYAFSVSEVTYHGQRGVLAALEHSGSFE
ncbi:MAG: DUF6544 family protein, partial [Candidatus Methylophosphatis roskildensis]